ncbi:MAG: hypothetical protein K9K30_14345 [Burkholderiaceae bacterium]|nr:hypothetical protein [Sulfuritalea sp.]MCF8176415.1 hypothetical protein [Burkholderiaceae bacterium]
MRQFVADHGKRPNAKQLARIAVDAHDFAIPDGCFWSDARPCDSHRRHIPAVSVAMLSGRRIPQGDFLRGVASTIQPLRREQPKNES